MRARGNRFARTTRIGAWVSAATFAAAALVPAPAQARVILQYFETPWSELESRLPEIAMVGYDALWLPPPQKGTDGRRDVGFAVYDRFDLGDKDQRGTIPTRYGVRDELVSMCDASHRHGVRLFFDVVMNHNGNPSLIENTGVDLPIVGLEGFPDTVPLDYHVLIARPVASSPGAYEVMNPAQLGGGTWVLTPKSDGNPEESIAAAPLPAELAAQFPGWTHVVRAPRVIFDGDLTPFENQSYSLLGLADFALDVNGTNATTATALPKFIRQPDCPACYPGGTPVAENIVEYILRWMRWLADVTDADGFRLDAVRHAPTQFFELYNKTIQDDYDARFGKTDTNDKDLVDDAQLFGESFTGDIFGELKAYYETGMQMLNFPLFFNLDGMLSSGSNGGGDLGQLSYPQGGDTGALNEFGGLGRQAGVSFVQSHDSPPPSGQANLAYAFIMTRVGDPVVFYDGNNPDPASFVQPGRPDALGELGSRVIKDLIWVHNHFARGGMWNRFVDDDAYVYERVVPNSGATLLTILHDNIGGDGRVDGNGVAHFGVNDPRPLLVTAFPPGTQLVELTGAPGVPTELTVLDPNAVSADARNRALAEFDRSSDAGVPPGYGLVPAAVPSGPEHGYAMYAPKVPQGPRTGARALTVLQAGQRVDDLTLTTVGEKRTATGARVAPVHLTVAHITGNTVTLQARTDGTAAAVYLSLDGGRIRLGNRDLVTGTPEGAFDGSVEMTSTGTATDGDKLWEIPGVDTTGLAEGVHVLRARAMRRGPNNVLLWNTFVVPIVVDRVPGGGPDLEPLDRDGDGVATSEDNCPDDVNADQADFDADHVGDTCDLCPLAGPAPMLDADGCRALDETTLQEILAVVDEVFERRASIVDVVRKIDEVNP